jgi:hypothetical protein
MRGAFESAEAAGIVAAKAARESVVARNMVRSKRTLCIAEFLILGLLECPTGPLLTVISAPHLETGFPKASLAPLLPITRNVAETRHMRRRKICGGDLVLHKPGGSVAW